MKQFKTSSVPTPALAICLLKSADGARYCDLDTSRRSSGGPGFLAGTRIDSSESWEALAWQF